MGNLAPKRQQEIQEIPLGLVNGNRFGRYPKISIEETFNFIISDDALVPYAGYKAAVLQSPEAEGRALYASTAGKIMIAVLGASVYSIDENLVSTFVGTIGSSTSATNDVFISENNAGQIAISDGTAATLYVYNWKTPGTPGPAGWTVVALPADIKIPGYISFQNGTLILANLESQNWYLSKVNKAALTADWPTTSQFVGTIQTKPDTIQAAVPVPGGGSNILIFGNTFAEPWNYTGGALFPYQKYATNNVDYGCLNASSIASLDNYIVWLAANEQSGATVMVYSGKGAHSISTDGIDFRLANLSNPTNCVGFLFRQDGHVLYQFTFPDDNLSYVYDINTGKFFTVTDENLNYHIAHNVVYFAGDYYFVSLKGGNVYRFGTQYTDADYGAGNVFEIPRLRVLPPFRLPSQRMFILKSLGFTIENGQRNVITTYPGQVEQQGGVLCTESSVEICTEGGESIAAEGELVTALTTYTLASEVVDLSLSRDGGETFGASVRQNMNPTGVRKSRFIYQRLGQANDVTAQLRFSGFGRFVVFEGEYEVYV